MLHNALGLETDDCPQTTMAPYVIKDKETWDERLLFYTQTRDYCCQFYHAVCEKDVDTMVVKMYDNCTDWDPHYRKLGYNGVRECANDDEWVYSYSDLAHKKRGRKDLYVIDGDGNADVRKMEDGMCVRAWRRDPRSGLLLTKLDPDLVPEKFNDKAVVSERLFENLLVKIHDSGIEVNESLYVELQNIINQQNIGRDHSSWDEDRDGWYGKGQDQLKKWIMDAAFESRVSACLCCLAPHVNEKVSLADQCASAMVFGGTKQSDKSFWSNAKHGLGVAAGTAEKIVKTVMNDLIPYVGQHLFKGGHQMICKFACQMRETSKWAYYQYPHTKEIPGYALKLTYGNFGR